MLSTLLLPLVPLLLAPTPRDEEPDMRVLLQAIADSIPKSPYQGDLAVRNLEAKVEKLAGQPRSLNSAWLLRALGVAQMRIGREREAIKHLEEARTHLPDDTPSDLRAVLSREIAVAWLRLAETENCCQRNTAESCIVPLRDGAIHSRLDGSTNAIAHLERMLEEAGEAHPERALGKWLLNVAYMTLDRYPDDVPEEHRIDPKYFRSEIDFPAFTNVARELDVANFSLAGGVVVEDLDLDGDFDILTSTNDLGGSLRLYLSKGGKSYRECHAAAGLDGLFGGLNMVHADYDDDGDPDILVLRGGWLRGRGRHPNSLLRNNGLNADGQLTFTDVTFAEGLGEVHYPTQAAGWADYDRDGDLDLYVGNEDFGRTPTPSQLFRNGGPHTEAGDGAPKRFLDVAESAGVRNERYAKGVSWGDYDADGDPDLFISNFTQDNRLYRNEGDGTFQDVAPELGLVEPANSFPAWFWDYDNDGFLDLFVSNYQPAEVVALYYQDRATPTDTHPRLWRNQGDGTFTDATAKAGLNRPMAPMGCNFGDLNNDGYVDAYLGTGNTDFVSIMPNLMFLGDGGQRFVDITMAGGFGHLQKGHGVAFADLDGDGDQDVFEQMGGAYAGDKYGDALYRNPGFDNRWLSVFLVGRESNRSAIGARIAVTVSSAAEGRRTIYGYVGSGAGFGSSPLEQHLGLGQAERILHVEVSWPGGVGRQRFADVPLDRRIVITEGVPEFGARPLR